MINFVHLRTMLVLTIHQEAAASCVSHILKLLLW